MPSGPPVGGWGGVKPAKTRTRAAFLPAEGGELDYGGRLWRDCGDATLSLWLAHRYRESFCLACAAGVRIKKTAQNSNSGRFFHRRGPRSMLRKEPPSRRSLATERLPEGGEGGGGGEILQNSNSGALLAEGIYLNRRGSKMAMLLGCISIQPFLAPPLPRQRSTTPHAGRW